MEWKEYFRHKMKNFFRWSTFINIELGYFMSFLIATISAFVRFNYGIPIGFFGFFLCIIYNDKNSGRWKHEQREEYKIKGFTMRIAELEEENKKLRERLDGIPKTE